MQDFCKDCDEFTNVTITRTRKLKTGEVKRDYHCHNCKRSHSKPKPDMRKRTEVVIFTETSNWDKRARYIVNKISAKYRNNYVSK